MNKILCIVVVFAAVIYGWTAWNLYQTQKSLVECMQLRIEAPCETDTECEEMYGTGWYEED